MMWLKVARMLPKLPAAGKASCASVSPWHAASSCLVAQLLWRNASSKASFMIPAFLHRQKLRGGHNKAHEAFSRAVHHCFGCLIFARRGENQTTNKLKY